MIKRSVVLIGLLMLAGGPERKLATNPNIPDIYTPVRVNTVSGGKKENKSSYPLKYTFDFTISIGWAATKEEIEKIKAGMGVANDMLFDATEGQMRFNRVEIYNNKAKWNEADGRMTDDPKILPQAFGKGADGKKGYLAGRRYTHINLTKFPFGNDVPEDGIDGGRDWSSRLAGYTLVHEFFHYACGLEDEADKQIYVNDHCIMRGDSEFKHTPQAKYEWEPVMTVDLCAGSHAKNSSVPFSCWDQLVMRYPALTKASPKPGPDKAVAPEIVVK